MRSGGPRGQWVTPGVQPVPPSRWRENGFGLFYMELLSLGLDQKEINVFVSKT